MNKDNKRKIQRFFGKFTGANRQQEEIETLYYFLNNYLDIKSIGPTKNKDLRDLQLCSTELLAVFDKVCDKNGLTWWLDYGSILGCIRHNGFIPWDDDMDIAMPREDYNRLIPLIKDEMQGYGIVVRSGGYYDDRGPMERLAIAYKTLETGAWIDVFPVDKIEVSAPLDEIKDIIYKKNNEYNKIYRKNKHKWSEEEFIKLKSEMYKELEKGKTKIYFHGQEFEGCNDFIMSESDVFPLQKHKFENYYFNVPNNYDMYLRQLFGDSYMSYPRTGVEHHMDPDGTKASERARKNQIDMNKEIKYLKSIMDN